MGHQDDGLGPAGNGMLDGGQGADDTLVVGDVLVVVEGNVEVDLEDADTSVSQCWTGRTH